MKFRDTHPCLKPYAGSGHRCIHEECRPRGPISGELKRMFPDDQTPIPFQLTEKADMTEQVKCNCKWNAIKDIFGSLSLAAVMIVTVLAIWVW